MAKELVSLREERERTIAVLSNLFARDDLELEEFERRLTLAHRATSSAELAEILADVPELDKKPPATTTALASTPAATVEPSGVRLKQNVIAFMGGARRRGSWTCARKLRVVAIMGGVELDFREARLGPGVTEIQIVALMGGVQIYVPPGLAVETEGVGIIGGFDAIERAPVEPDPERPVLHIHGVAIMGGVDVRTRLPGESGREARLRRREERRQLRRARRRELPPHPHKEEDE